MKSLVEIRPGGVVVLDWHTASGRPMDGTKMLLRYWRELRRAQRAQERAARISTPKPRKRRRVQGAQS